MARCACSEATPGDIMSRGEGARVAGESPDGDQRLLESLVAAKRLTREQATYVATESRRRSVRAATILMEKGVLRASPAPGTSAPVSAPPGPYVLVRELGRGAMGVVHKGYDLVARRYVAVKLLQGHPGGVRLKRFQLEAEAARKLKHPAIVGAHAFGEHEGNPYLVMELIEGESLDKLLARPIPPKWIAQLMRGIALALDHAHKNGVVHRDVKPANVIVDKEGQPHLTDFGLARDLSDSGQNVTQEGSMLGTPAYMAPELAGEASEQGPHSDVYSLGAILYCALVGRPPFEAPSIAALVKKLLFERPVPPHELKPEVDRRLEEIALRCLEKDPKDRFGSAADLAAALEKYMGFADAPPEEPQAASPEPVVDDAEKSEELVLSGDEKTGSRATSRRLGTSSSRHRAVRTTRPRTAEDREKETLKRVLTVLIPLGLLFLIGIAVAMRL